MEAIDGRMPVLVGCGDVTDLATPAAQGRSPYDLIARASRLALRDAFRRGSLVPLAVPGRDFRRELYLIIHRSKFRSVALQRWLELCRESAGG